MILESHCCPDCPEVEIKPCKPLFNRTPLRDRTVTPERITQLLSYSRGETSSRQLREAIRRTPQTIQTVFLFANSTRSTNPTIADALVDIRNRTAVELKLQGFTISLVPVGLDVAQAIAWVNQRAKPGDVVLSIQTDAYLNPNTRGVSAFYRAGDEIRRQRADQLINQILTHVPNWIDRGVRPDTETAFGNLALIRQIKIPSVVLTVGFTTSPEDRKLMLNRSQAIAQGIANGITRWDRTPIAMKINLNGKASTQQGLIVENSAYVPIQLLDQLAIDLNRPRTARLFTYNNTTYIRAIDLQASGVFVGWNESDRTTILRTMLPLNPNKISSIMGRGYLSKDTLESFLQQNNPQALATLPEIASLYLEESELESVNADIAFTQALIETNFFRFGGTLQVAQNNFAALREVGSVSESATFPNARTGVRAHIQLLKAYASLEPFSQEIVTPRFRFIERGSAPQVEQLSFYYSSDPAYGDDILGTLRQLYQYQFARSFSTISTQ